MLILPGFVDHVIETGAINEIENPTLSRLANLMIGYFQNQGKLDAGQFSLSLEDPEMAALVAGWLQPRPEEDDLRPEVDGSTAVEQSLNRLKSKKILRRKREIQESLSKCVPGDQQYNDLAGELLTIGRRLRS